MFETHSKGQNEIQQSGLRERREAAPREQAAWGRGRGRVLMLMGGRRSAFEFQCLDCSAYALDCCLRKVMRLSNFRKG